jgi:serine/threonine-protein kinase
MSRGSPYWNQVVFPPGFFNSFGAIAYSPSTRRYSWSYGQPDQMTAEQAARKYCEAHDATILCWGHNTALALALSADGSYGFAWGEDAADVRRRALQACQGTNCHIVLLYHTWKGNNLQT